MLLSGSRIVQKWLEPTIDPPKPTVELSVSACFAVRQNGAGAHDDLVIAAALSLERERVAGLLRGHHGR